MEKEAFYTEGREFLSRLESLLEQDSVTLKPHWDIDHICYRVSSDTRYKKMREFLASLGRELIESEVNGRLISTYKLNEPFVWKGKEIHLLELPAPKAGKDTANGFEHIEVVCDQPFEKLKETYSQARWKDKGLQKSFNQELELQLEGCALKFHQLSLESVVTLEKNQRIFSAILGSQVLEILREYRPLIAGTYPLGLDQTHSDVDVILGGDIEAIERTVNSHYVDMEEFECHGMDVDDVRSLICRFRYRGVTFELFAQEEESVRQRAYLHFLIEERLLKLGGEEFRQSVISLRQQGLKTEPAFAKALGIKEDPYLALLELQTKSDTEIKRHGFSKDV